MNYKTLGDTFQEINDGRLIYSFRLEINGCYWQIKLGHAAGLFEIALKLAAYPTKKYPKWNSPTVPKRY